MSAITFAPCKFTNLRTGNESYGFRVYDEFGQFYDNTWDSVPDDDLEFLQKVIEKHTDDEIKALLDHMQEMEQGCNIGDEWYDWDEIMDLF